MTKFYQWLHEGAGSRSMQLSIVRGGKFEAIAIEKGVIVSQGTGATADAALISMAVGIMNKLSVLRRSSSTLGNHSQLQRMD